MLSAGDSAPAFTLNDLLGGSSTLKDLAADTPALLAFYKASCPVCQMTMPYLERLAKSTNVNIVAVSQDDAETTEEFRKEFGITYTTLIDPEAKGYRASNDFGITHVPSMFLVEPDGDISMAWTGWSKRDMKALGNVAGLDPFRKGESVPDFRAG